MEEYSQETLDDYVCSKLNGRIEEELNLLVDKLVEVGLVDRSGVGCKSDFQDVMRLLGNFYRLESRTLPNYTFKKGYGTEYKKNISSKIKRLKMRELKSILEGLDSLLND